MARCPGCGKYQLGPVVDDHPCNPPIMDTYHRPTDAEIIKIKDKRIRELEEAAKEIVKSCGKVCEGYDTCTHVACESSHRAWEIARKALE